jgi:hypothetical protein
MGMEMQIPDSGPRRRNGVGFGVDSGPECQLGTVSEARVVSWARFPENLAVFGNGKTAKLGTLVCCLGVPSSTLSAPLARFLKNFPTFLG